MKAENLVAAADGTSPTTAMTHVAVQEHQNGKVVEWMEKVSDEQYLGTPSH